MHYLDELVALQHLPWRRSCEWTLSGHQISHIAALLLSWGEVCTKDRNDPKSGFVSPNYTASLSVPGIAEFVDFVCASQRFPENFQESRGGREVGHFASFIPFEKGFITYVWSAAPLEAWAPGSKIVNCCNFLKILQNFANF